MNDKTTNLFETAYNVVEMALLSDFPCSYVLADEDDRKTTIVVADGEVRVLSSLFGYPAATLARVSGEAFARRLTGRFNTALLRALGR